MECNNELKEIDIENRMYYHFGDIILINDLDLDNISLDEKTLKNNLIYDVAYKTPKGAKPLGIIFDKVDKLIRKLLELSI